MMSFEAGLQDSEALQGACVEGVLYVVCFCVVYCMAVCCMLYVFVLCFIWWCV